MHLMRACIHMCVFEYATAFLICVWKRYMRDFPSLTTYEPYVTYRHDFFIVCITKLSSFLFSSDFSLLFVSHCRYCSNYYSESSGPIEQCDWCRSEERSGARQGNSSKKSATGTVKPSEYSGDRTKQDEAPEKGKSPGNGPSPRQATRRYKLLKDVMCWIKEICGWSPSWYREKSSCVRYIVADRILSCLHQGFKRPSLAVLFSSSLPLGFGSPAAAAPLPHPHPTTSFPLLYDDEVWVMETFSSSCS